ncbi:MAG: thioredoxin family protein [Myxococcales bacterium]|nr:thioredoxin family protein [Myxococcales bacterium]
MVALLALLVARAASAQAPGDGACVPDETASCAPVAGSGGGAARAPDAPRPDAAAARATLVVFWGIGCPHCEEARPRVAELAAAHPELEVEWVEVRRDAAGRARLLATAERLGVQGPGIPLFVVGQRAIVGYRGASTRAELEAAVEDALAGRAGRADVPRTVELPLFGAVDPSALSLPAFTLLIGLADGINPCAFYVLIVLLGILLHVRSRARIALYGGIFVVMSGLVYFLFMTVWLGLFQLVGVSRYLTLGLGVVLVAMGLVNLKELVWFKKGVSLMVPDKAKPGLFRRMRGIASAASLPAAILGISALAFVVNLVELGCTLGLPAVYTRILSLRHDLSPGGRVGYLVLYNAAYVVPLALIVGIYAATLHRLTLGERAAKILKAVSGTLLLLFGVLFIAAPDLLR